MSSESIGNEFVKPFVSALVGAAVSAFVTVSHMQTSIAVLESKVQRVESAYERTIKASSKLTDEIHDLSAQLSYMKGQRYGKDM